MRDQAHPLFAPEPHTDAAADRHHLRNHPTYPLPDWPRRRAIKLLAEARARGAALGWHVHPPAEGIIIVVDHARPDVATRPLAPWLPGRCPWRWCPLPRGHAGNHVPAHG